MRVLFYRYGSVCEPDIIEAFEELGHEVLQMTDEMTDKTLVPGEVVRRINARLSENPVDFIFSINFFPPVSEVCRIYRLPYLSWSVDCPVLELFSKSVTNDCNKIFLFDRKQYEDVHRLNPGGTYHLPLAANVKHKDAVISTASEDKIKKFTSDITFVGSLYTEKTPWRELDKSGVSDRQMGFVEGLMSAQQKVYGYYFTDEVMGDEFASEFAAGCNNFYPVFSCLHDENYITDKLLLSQFYVGNEITARERVKIAKELGRRLTIYTASDTSSIPGIDNRGTVKTLEEMPIVFNRSRVNLSLTSRAIRSGLAFRVFDVLSCGGFLITDFQEELPEQFNIGSELAAFSSSEELEELIAYYLSHESERAEIAHEGYEAIKNRHTFVIRMEQMLRMAFGEGR